MEKYSNILGQDSLTEDFPEKMCQESGTSAFSAPSPSDIIIQHPNKHSRISYTREFLLSLSRADTAARLPREVKLSLPCSVLEDSSGLLSPPFCVPDSGCKSKPQNSSMKTLDSATLLLHRSSEPYRPPCRHKASPASIRDENDSVDSDTSGTSESTDQEKAEGERWSKGMVTLPGEDIWYSSKNTDSKEYSEEFIMSPSVKNSKTLHSTFNAISQQSDASQKQSLVQGDAVRASFLQDTTEGFSTQQHQGQKSRNQTDTSLHTPSMSDDSKLQVGYPEGAPQVMELLQKSKPPNFFSQENSGTVQQNHCEVEYEKLIMELRLTSTPVHVHGIAKSDLSETSSVSLSHQEDEKQFISADFELCLPEEDSLINFDEPFLMRDFENSAVVEADTPSSPRLMVEKLIESLLNDESCPAPNLDEPIVHHGAGLEGYYDSLHAQQSYKQLCSNQLNPIRDEQAQSSFQRTSTSPAIYSLFSSNTTCLPFPLSHEELRQFHDQLRRSDPAVSQPMFQQMINPGKRHLCASQSEVNMPLQMSCTQRLNSMQNRTYGPFMGSTPDSHSDGDINQAVLDRLVDMSLRPRHWNPYVGGF